MIFDFIDYVRSRWRFPAIAAGTAIVAAVAAGWLLTPRYTAMASILIDAPGGLDPRAATAVSPVYLESLRTYEHFASSDSLFAEAIAHLQIRQQYAGVPLESLKSHVLKVQKPRDTKILEISVTLNEPKKAQALAQYIAEKTVSLSRSLDQSADLVEQARARVNAAQTRLAAADNQIAASGENTEGLHSEIDAAVDLNARVRRDLAETKTDLAEFLSKEQTAPANDRERISQQIAGLRARIAELQHQDAASETTVQTKQALLGKREARINNLLQEQRSARTELDSAIARLNEINATAGLRSETLKIIDPGIVPERPSFPNRPLLVVAAAVISTVLSIAYLAVAFQFGRSRIHDRERPFAYR